MNEPHHPAHAAALAHALRAADRGLAVIPLSRTKLPAVRSPHRAEPRRIRCHGECGQIGHGIHDATTDPTAVRALFAAAPWATGYGIACGRTPHHLIGIDLDVKNDVDGIANFEALAVDRGFAVPASITVATPSGGRHLWLRGPADRTVPNSVGRLAPGIDVRGTGGYLVGPGSTTNRGTYTLAPGTEHQALAAVPDALLQLLAPPAVASHRSMPALPIAGRQAVALVQFVLDAPDGQRNDRLYWAACRAHETTDAPALAAALIEAAVRIGLPEPEARATVTSAARRISARGAR
ncbi:bifunctional DNA primase/polymerase [Streptomyces cylindrosporus]|uniref:Bifunctional DNA primase/polymerase n=1 Tax=Streptomyces cylindrosporus TaxID=2927583 RepID=A0ABS9YGB6_9ACTN|nr:bifunctional DNA primase/polymerase [Streptomyces cylindrosporus]MCI3276259.1 bifunctional DNA primase/polymerase [Streptomyces cylindrosporus]